MTRQSFETSTDGQPGASMLDDRLGRTMMNQHREPVLVVPTRTPMVPGLDGDASIGDASPLLESYSKLSSLDAAAVTRAAGQFADALWWADADPRISWIKLVGALETASNRFDRSTAADDPVKLLKRHRGQLYGELKRVDTKAVRVVANALTGTLNAERKLLAFVDRYPPIPPAARPEGARVDFSNLAPVLRTIYEHRSRDLHDGIPFPQPLCEPPVPREGIATERFPALGAQAYGGTWDAETLPVYFHTFAHIVRESLLAWWADTAEHGRARP